jgi:hypothetical protein
MAWTPGIVLLVLMITVTVVLLRREGVTGRKYEEY